MKEVDRVPLFGQNKERVHTNMKKDLLDSDNFSKFNHSSDSSFARTFNKLIEESQSLKWQYRFILRQKLKVNDEIYDSFVKKIISKNNDLLQSYSRSMPLNRNRENIFE